MQNQKITIRECKQTDIDSILPLMEQLGYPAEIEQLTKRFSNFINIPGYGVAIATSNDSIIGLIAWSRSNLFVKDGTRIHIEALVVDKEHRKTGVGETLMKHLEKYAKRNNICHIDLTSGTRRAIDGSHDFYNKLGYKNDGYMSKVYLRKELV